MKNAPYHYFEVYPSKDAVVSSKEVYLESSLILGRVCVDVGLIIDKKLILIERTVPPVQGPWLAGGRIQWGKFTNIYDYARQSMQEHFGVASMQKNMTMLKPRFYCFKERPFPEAVFWFVGTISKQQYKNISLDTREQSHIHTFASRNELQLHMRSAKLSVNHRSILLDLWDELTELGLLAN